MKLLKLIPALVLALLLAAGCDRPAEYAYEVEYLPVQLVGSQKWSILDVRTGALVTRDAYDMMPGAIVGGMYYVMNAEGAYDYYDVSDPAHPINKESYGSVTAFGTNGRAVASHRGGPLEVIDRHGNTVATLPQQVVQCTMFSQGLAAYQNEHGLWGYLDERGDTVIAAHYGRVHGFLHTDRAVVVDEAQASDTALNFTVIDKAGKQVFTASTTQYAPIQPYYVSGVLPVVSNDSIVCLDRNGRETANPNNDHSAVDSARYDDYSRTAAGLYLIVKQGKMGLVDNKNKTLIKPEFDRLIDLSADRYIAINDTVCHLVDRQGQAVGDARFVHVHGTLDNEMATRGTVDTDLAVASMMMLFGPDRCCGAGPATTLMDMNSLLGTDPEPYAGANFLNRQQGPFIIQYVFDRPVATVAEGNAPAAFDLEARVTAVLIAMDLSHTGIDTEPTIVRKAQAVMGTRGFVFESDGVFTSDSGTALTMGYDRGIFNLYYFMRRADVQPLPANPRK